MTRHHGLDNLLWVWTSQVTDPDWYPGDDYVDMVGRDIYNEQAASTIKSQFTTLLNRYPGANRSPSAAWQRDNHFGTMECRCKMALVYAPVRL